MLTPSEFRRWKTTLRHIDHIEKQITSLESAAPFEHMPIVDAEIAKQTLADLKAELAEREARLPAGDVLTLLGHRNNLTYDRCSYSTISDADGNVKTYRLEVRDPARPFFVTPVLCEPAE